MFRIIFLRKKARQEHRSFKHWRVDELMPSIWRPFRSTTWSTPLIRHWSPSSGFSFSLPRNQWAFHPLYAGLEKKKRGARGSKVQDKGDEVKYCCLIKVGRQLRPLIFLPDTSRIHLQLYILLSANYRNNSIKRREKTHNCSTAWAAEGADLPDWHPCSLLFLLHETSFFQNSSSQTELPGKGEGWPATIRVLESALVSFVTTLHI